MTHFKRAGEAPPLNQTRRHTSIPAGLLSRNWNLGQLSFLWWRGGSRGDVGWGWATVTGQRSCWPWRAYQLPEIRASITSLCNHLLFSPAVFQINLLLRFPEHDKQKKSRKNAPFSPDFGSTFCFLLAMLCLENSSVKWVQQAPTFPGET